MRSPGDSIVTVAELPHTTSSLPLSSHSITTGSPAGKVSSPMLANDCPCGRYCQMSTRHTTPARLRNSPLYLVFLSSLIPSNLVPMSFQHRSHPLSMCPISFCSTPRSLRPLISNTTLPPTLSPGPTSDRSLSSGATTSGLWLAPAYSPKRPSVGP